MLTLKDHIHMKTEIVSAVLDARAARDSRAFVFAPGDLTSAKRVENWGWLRRLASGYGSPSLLHPAVGTTFTVATWRYSKSRHLGQGGTGPLYIDHQYFRDAPNGPDCVLIARLDDGRIFADGWADRSVLHNALSRWRNARGYTVDWDEPGGLNDPPTCAIGGLDWATIPELIRQHRTRQARERTTV